MRPRGAGSTSTRTSTSSIRKGSAPTRFACRAATRRPTRTASRSPPMFDSAWPWLTLALLGAYHGINPAMGWLFAVSQGMQHGERRAVLRSLVPIAIGHEASIALVAGVVIFAEETVDPASLHIAAAAVLFAFGIFRFAKPRAHWRWTTMRVSGRELTLWSFLMSTAHGAGVMVAPVLLGFGSTSAAAASL